MKSYEFEGYRYDVSRGTAIELCDLDQGDYARQDVLIVDEYHDGIVSVWVVFGWRMIPQSEACMIALFESWEDWENDQSVLDTIERL